MSSIDIRTYEEDDEIEEIVFGDDETLITDAEDHNIFYVRSEGKQVSVYMGSIDNMIAALTAAKDLWSE